MVAAVALCAACTPLWSQAYPVRPVRLIVPFPPGGGTDIVARTLAAKLGEQIGQQIVIDNRGGAGGNLGTEIAARAAADGYTLFMVTGTQTVNATLLRSSAFDLVRDFDAIAQVASVPLAIVVHPGVAARTVADLVELARAKPGHLILPSAGNGTSTHLGAEVFRAATGARFTHVPYKGSAPAVTDLVGGHGQVMFANLASVLAQIKGGRLRALAVTSQARSPMLPETPTVAEALVPGFEVIQWYGVLAPRGVGAKTIEYLHTRIARAQETAELRARLAQDGAVPVRRSPAEFAAFIEAEIARWAKVIKESGARAD